MGEDREGGGYSFGLEQGAAKPRKLQQRRAPALIPLSPKEWGSTIGRSRAKCLSSFSPWVAIRRRAPFELLPEREARLPSCRQTSASRARSMSPRSSTRALADEHGDSSRPPASLGSQQARF